MLIKEKFVHCFLSVILILFFYSSFSFAQSIDNSRLETLLAVSLDELINVDVTLATDTPKPIKLAPAVATVVTADEIKRICAATLDEALQTVAGLRFTH